MTLFIDCLLLMFVQYAAAVPWLLAWTWQARSSGEPKTSTRTAPRPALALLVGFGIALGLGIGLGVLARVNPSRELLDGLGKGYGCLLQLQLQADLLVGVFAALMWLWPKGAAVARAAFREGYRQPMFWLLAGIALILLILFPLVPYFTFGEDYITVKELGMDAIMMAATIFGVLAAAMSISEEIEGRTAVTLMSKPVSRRQFLLGKFAGIFLCCLMLIMTLGWLFDLILFWKRFDPQEEQALVLAPGLSAWLESLAAPSEVRDLIRGIFLWGQHISEVVPGLTMSASLVMILVAVAVTLATRLPMIVNQVVCLVVFFLSNLAPILVLSTRPDPAKTGPVQKLLHFTAQTIDTLLPGLELFRVRPTMVDESTLPLGQYVQHVGAVTVYGILFTTIVLLLGLVLFEDRDLG